MKSFEALKDGSVLFKTLKKFAPNNARLRELEAQQKQPALSTMFDVMSEEFKMPKLIDANEFESAVSDDQTMATFTCKITRKKRQKKLKF